MTVASPADHLDAFLDLALVGNARQATRVALELLDSGVPEDVVIADLLAAAQRQVGDRWQRDELGVADEHIATGVSQTALYALADAAASPSVTGLVVVACAEGDWHALPAHMFAEQLRANGVTVAYLGASTPADQVARFLGRHRPEALAVSCSLPLFFEGVARLADVAHRVGVPVLVGGRALEDRPAAALRLGADGAADNIADALEILNRWRDKDTPVSVDPVQLPPDAVHLGSRALELADGAFDDLARRFTAISTYDTTQLTRTREDLAFIVRFIAAAQLVDDPVVFTDFLDWLAQLLDARGVPMAALAAGLQSLQPLLSLVSLGAGRLGDIGLRHLTDGS